MTDLLGPRGFWGADGGKALPWIPSPELKQVRRIRELARYLECRALEGVERNDVGEGVSNGVRIGSIQRKLCDNQRYEYMYVGALRLRTSVELMMAPASPSPKAPYRYSSYSQSGTGLVKKS